MDDLLAHKLAQLRQSPHFDALKEYLKDRIEAARDQMEAAHSVEVFAEDVLVGGVYGVRIGGFFAGESMFHTRTDASKVALVALMALLVSGGITLFDVQWVTPHLASLGAIEVSRDDYLRLLAGTRKGPSSRQTADHD